MITGKSQSNVLKGFADIPVWYENEEIRAPAGLAMLYECVGLSLSELA
jgi:hypothetical protein